MLAELPGPDVLRSGAEVVAYAGLNPRLHQSGTSIDRMTRISKIGNAVLRAALYMPAMSAMQHNPAIVALVARLKARGRLKPKQIVVAAMRKLLVLCFGVLKTGKPFDPAIDNSETSGALFRLALEVQSPSKRIGYRPNSYPSINVRIGSWWRTASRSA